MAPAATRPAVRPSVVASAINILDLLAYAGDFTIAEGDYALFFDGRIHAYKKKDGSSGQNLLGVMLTAFPLAGGDPVEQFMSMGGKAIQSLAPDPASPGWNKIGSNKFVPIPGAPAANLAGQSNWALFLKSFYDCAPEIANLDLTDLSVLNGTWAHIVRVPEPAGRASMGPATGEVAQNRPSEPKLIPAVSQIMDDGKPWADGGGMPENATVPEAPAAAPKAAPKAAAKPVAVAKKAAPAPAPVVDQEGGDEEVRAAAKDAIETVLTANPNGLPKIGFRTAVFSAATASVGNEMAQSIMDDIMGDEDLVNQILGENGYILKGGKVQVS